MLLIIQCNNCFYLNIFIPSFYQTLINMERQIHDEERDIIHLLKGERDEERKRRIELEHKIEDIIEPEMMKHNYEGKKKLINFNKKVPDVDSYNVLNFILAI